LSAALLGRVWSGRLIGTSRKYFKLEISPRKLVVKIF